MHFVSKYLIYFLACQQYLAEQKRNSCLFACLLSFSPLVKFYICESLLTALEDVGRSFKFCHTALYALDDANLPKIMRNVWSIFLFKSWSFHWTSKKDWSIYRAWDTLILCRQLYVFLVNVSGFQLIDWKWEAFRCTYHQVQK